jgi:autotransporter passenger strand-loop-strand repeat protein
MTTDVISSGQKFNQSVNTPGVTYVDSGLVSSTTFDGPGSAGNTDPLLVIERGGIAVDIIVNDSGNYDAVAVSSGGLLSDSTLLGGNTNVYAGGTADGITVNDAGLEISGGTASGVTIQLYGHEEVYAGGSTAATTVGSGGSATIYAGGTADALTVSAGGIVYDYGVVSSSIVVEPGASTNSDLLLAVEKGGVATGITVSASGDTDAVAVESGGKLSNSDLLAGNTNVYSGGTADNITVNDAGLEISGGTASGVDIVSGGHEDVYAGGITTNTTIGAGGTLNLAAGAAATGTITFNGPGTLNIAGSTMPTATLLNVGAGDVINLTGVAYVPGAFAFSIGDQLNIVDGLKDFVLDVGDLKWPYQVGDHDGYVELLPCFAAGTRILTTAGEVAVEDLRVGDTVVTVRDGGPDVREIIWTGRRSLDISRHAEPELVWPVRICAGAFAPGLPERDLRVSPLHALYIDGHLIEARALINGATVIQETETRWVTYHHIELTEHDILLAEGLATESYLDTGSRHAFEGEATLQLHPDFRPLGDADFCAPMVRDGEILAAARQQLLDRAEALGFTRTAIPALTAKADGADLPAAQEHKTWRFTLPEGATSVELLSPAVVPAVLAAAPADSRRLGVAIAKLMLIAGGERTAIALDDPGHDGFHNMEDGHRWTNGAAAIALPPHRGPAVLEVTLCTAGQPARWTTAAIRDRRAA